MFFLPYVYILKLVEKSSKWVKNMKKLTPDLTSGSDLGCWEP